MKTRLLSCLFVLVLSAGAALAGSYPIVDTGQEGCFDDTRQIDCPEPGGPFDGQDAQYRGNVPRYRDNGDGTVSDLVTGLMWVKERGEPVTWREGMDGAATCRVGGYADWRAPTIKELYSLIDFNGYVQSDERNSVPYIDTRYFDFRWGDMASGRRIIDCQDWSATVYRGTTMDGNRTAFGVNFADGRIKGYPMFDPPGHGRSKYMRYVRGNSRYGLNDFRADGPMVEDRATGLTWQQADDGVTRNWEQALAYCRDLDLGGRTDWRLPSAKELESIVDYSRSPTATNSAAIDPVFAVTNPESYFWTSTTHLDGPRPDHAVYIAFGRAMGWFSPPRSNRPKTFMDVHGAGAQRSDPKSGDPGRFPQGHGPQGDDIRILNYVRCVTGGGVAYYEPSNPPIPAWTGGHPGQRDPNMARQMNGGPGMSPGVEQPQDMERQEGMNGPSGRRRPPPEAFTACESKSQGDGCTVQTPHGTLQGICRNLPDGTVCVPQGR
ncbi:MAG: DUF1566 domain-containing protein [Pseudodesulfovibrio sp.]|uniref:Lcl C-terminal domain-containing protein n=1 Tax=Pseudodesulfovibrio sp. TaxID=2035812 RepID=UPI003D0D791B